MIYIYYIYIYSIYLLFQTMPTQGSCCLSLLDIWTLVLILWGVCCHLKVTSLQGSGLRKHQQSTGLSGRQPSASRSFCCAWRRRTRDWRVSQSQLSSFVLAFTHGQRQDSTPFSKKIGTQDASCIPAYFTSLLL